MNRPLLLFAFRILAILIVFAPSSAAFAAACCGGGFATPSLIAGDDKAQLTTSFTHSEIKADVYADGLWNGRNYKETIETLKLEVAHIFVDRFQAGLSVPVTRRSRESESSSGFGDITTSFGYEYLPDWDYNPWRPKGIGYLQLTLPTGRSIHEAQAPYQLDSRGRGFWALGAGTLLTKTFSKLDLFTSIDLHRSFEKSYEGSDGSGSLQPGWGGNFGIGAGYNWTSWRLGSSLTWTYEDSINVTGVNASSGSIERYATAAITASYLHDEEWASTFTYSDQTRFGSPLNTRLGQALIIQLQKRWPR